ncbi:allantoate amidohydrolase [Microbacterium sp. cx-59]|uniref:allantoate amidohydrolase n=1 Tax=Microbacterium sp. cx-59 TaxID=2891207 RepID=UPI001E3A8BB2|nr:allantoate amidohydrolase [Microbacterium sp. cx-59]MCC4908744.1 allantoate amidohydrolase [Microbacterium sp. cx-59]
MSVTSLLGEIADTGRDPVRGGYTRPVFSAAETDLRDWFRAAAHARDLDVETDRNGVIWAWWGAPHDGALVTGSHLDSVPGGGAFDGPLGVASALAAIDHLRDRGLQLTRSIAAVVFPEEEGSRFGVACLGSRLMTGALDPDRARALVDADGRTFAEAARDHGIDPAHIGADPAAVARIGQFVELHVEQGRGLGHCGPPVAIGDAVLGHGRWRFLLTGQGNHAGTTLMDDRRDPMIVAAKVVLAVRQLAASVPHARATVGRILPVPGGANVIASRVEVWLDVRHPDDLVTADLVARIASAAETAAAEEGCESMLIEESLSPTVHLNPGLRAQMALALPGGRVLDTGAGHDAAVLSAVVPSGMLFTRNAEGISHSPEEHVEDSDAEAGARALADVLEALL